MSRQPRGMNGLDAEQIVKQSTLCHPDWDVETHLGYLMHEELVNPEQIVPGPGERDVRVTITRWMGETS